MRQHYLVCSVRMEPSWVHHANNPSNEEAIAVYAALRYPSDLKACLRAAVNHGGDSDSTGAIAGNILGAWLGMAGIPEDWLSHIELADRIEELSDRMLQLLERC